MDSALVETFSDELNLRLLGLVWERPRSARELSILLSIPLSRTYRRIKRLELDGILEVVDRLPSGFGKRENVYRSRLRALEITYEVGKLHFRCSIEGRPPIVYDEEFREEILSKLRASGVDNAAPASAAPVAHAGIML